MTDGPIASILFELFGNFWPLLPTFAVLGVLAVLLGRATQPRFKSRALLNKSETKLFWMLTKLIPEGNRVLCQVSYGEFLSCKSRKRFFTINAKRADLVICDHHFTVVAVVEYQGQGHFGRTKKSRVNAKHRDNQKRRALTEASIPLLEIPAVFDQALVKNMLDAMMKPVPNSPQQ